MPRKIYEISIDEITLCKSPSNKRLFFIKKMEDKKMSKEFIDELKKFTSEDDQDIETALTKEEIAKAEKLSDEAQEAVKKALGIIGLYEDVPDDLEGALKSLVKQAAYDYPVVEEEVGKAGAKLSKTTQAQIKEALGHIKDGPKAVTILETLLGVEPKKTVKGKEDEKENLSTETMEKLERLEELEKKEKEVLAKEDEKKQAERIIEIVNKTLKDAGLDEIPQKKSIDEPTDDKDKKKDKKKEGADDDEDKFPSFPIPEMGTD